MELSLAQGTITSLYVPPSDTVVLAISLGFLGEATVFAHVPGGAFMPYQIGNFTCLSCPRFTTEISRQGPASIHQGVRIRGQYE